MSIFRTVHTTFYSKSAKDVIDAALKCISSQKFYSGKSNIRTAESAVVDISPNGEVIVTWDYKDISEWRLVSYVRGHNDVKARCWLAQMIKYTVYRELYNICDDHRQAWKRDNTQVSEYLTKHSDHNITIQDAYCIYDLLMGRKNTAKHYDAKLIADFNGTENDPFKTEMEVQRRNEVKLIIDEYQKKLDNANINSYYSEIHKKMDIAVEDILRQYRAESTKLMAEITAECDAKLKELNEQFSALAAIQLTPKQTQLRCSAVRGFSCL